MRDGTLEPDELSAASLFPLVYQQNATGVLAPHWEPIPIKTIRDVKQAVMVYGLQAPYTIGLILMMSNTYVMLPSDWKDMFRMILTSTQYVIWESEFRREAEALAARTPGIQAVEICGEGAFAPPTAQYNLSVVTLTLVSLAATQAITRVDDPCSIRQSFAKIVQGPNESYSEFIDKLQTAISRQISNADAQMEILRKLAYDNANTDCKNLLARLINSPNVTLAQFLKACQHVGTHTYNAEVLASALSKASSPSGNCFNCGKPGHFKAQCRDRGGGASHNEMNKEAKPKSVCPKCKKGYHWANQCRVKPNPDSGN
ncbi:endogenous retrovirus group K member 8 Gag polyprotein-like [Ahaetulla prasina]|uniref:endogenous retrovirus group K member 8 Gag polyprotein-like n=1 Tax=Ahaetulla prasina TaxID=499056 RepID=UPI002649BEC6|nr:endogenous retrovirus group K member 8 Gag polyprotein-like [Ahaetulla prasina]